MKMNSKEALQVVRNIIEGRSLGLSRECKNNILMIIEKDLEILEILKSNIKVKKYYDSFETGDDRQWLEVDLDNSDIQFKKVKEWLTDEINK